MGFWDDKINTAPQEPVMPRGDAQAYRAHRRQESGSIIYREPVGQQSRDVFVEKTYDGLGGYAGKAADKLARRIGESVESWRRRVQAVIRHLPEEEAAARLAEIDQAEQPQTHDNLRAALERSNVSAGLYGTMTPQDRASTLGSRFGGRELEANGHLVRSALATPGQKSLSIFDRQPAPFVPHFAQRTEAPAGSSGDGWVGVDGR